MAVFLALAATLFGCTTAVSVKMEFHYPELTLTVPDNGLGRIESVQFHYTIQDVSYKRKGTLTTDRGWQYQTSSIPPGAVTAEAYAVILQSGGKVRYTHRSTLLLRDKPMQNAQAVQPRRSVGGAVVFRDDFNTLDVSRWKHEVSMYGGMNWEFQVYSDNPKNTYVKDGKLYIMPTLTVDDPRFSGPDFLTTGQMDMTSLFGSCTNNARSGCTRHGKNGLLPPVMSGKLKSVPNIRYGTVEIRARIPTGDWIWPAMWMLPEHDEYGAWPRSGEIDIMESRGTRGSFGVGGVSSTLHWGPAFNQNGFPKTTGVQYSKSWAEDFHTWTLEWTPTYLRTTVDGKEILRVDVEGGGFWKKGEFDGKDIWSSGDKMAPFDKDFYMILNVAVGGTNGFFPDGGDYGGAKKPWNDNNSTADAPADFWNARNDWLKTWSGEKAALIVDYIEMKNW